MERFSARVRVSGTRVVVDVPFHPGERWGFRDRYHVTGTVGGRPWRGALESDGRVYFLRLGPAWLRDNGVDAGAEVEVELAPEGPQVDTAGADVAAALRAEPEAMAFFEGLPSFYRRNYMRWIDEAKRPATRATRIAEMVRLLREGRRER